MRYSTIAGAALLAPAAFASPLNARQAPAPTCNPNNVRALGQQKPKSTGFCTNWFKTTTTKHVAPVTVTGLSEPQISNLCSCILAPSYVSGRPLTSLNPTTTTGASSSAQTSSSAGVSSTTTSTSTTTSASSSPTAATCVDGDITAADGSIYTKSCASGLYGTQGQSSTVANAAACQAKCTGTCAGLVYTAVSRSCQLYTEVDGKYEADGTVAFVYKSGRASTSSSSSTSASSTTSSAATGAPSVFNIYIASASSATASGTMLRASGVTYPAGIYPSPTAAVAKRQAAAACASGTAVSNGQTFYKACGKTLPATGNTAMGAADQPDADDKISTLGGCIDFCAKKGSTSGVQNCKAVNFDETNTAFLGCTLYSTADLSTVTSTTTTNDIAYLYNEVPAGVFTIDARTGYVYSNDSTGNALCGAPSDRTVPATANKAAFDVKIGDVFIAPIDAATCIPLSCAIDSQSRLSCYFNNNNIYLGKPYLDPTSNLDANKMLIPQFLRLTAGSTGPISMYVAPASAASVTPGVVSSGADKSLFTTADLLVASPTTSTDHSFVGLTSAGAINETFVIDSTTTAASVTLFKDVFVYAQDTYRFTASASLTNGRLVGATCAVQFGFDVSQSSPRTYPNSVTLDSSFPASFDFVFEGKFANTKTVSASFDITCTTTSGAITIPVVVTNVKLVANPSAPLRANYEIPGSKDDYATNANAYIQFYSGNGTRIPDGTNPSTSTAVSGNTGSAIRTLYIGQSVSNQAAAIKACASQAVGTTPATPAKMFEIYFDTSDSYWKCITFASKNLPSSSLFTPGFATAATANPVYGYYLSNILPYSA